MKRILISIVIILIIVGCSNTHQTHLEEVYISSTLEEINSPSSNSSKTEEVQEDKIGGMMRFKIINPTICF